MYIYDWKSEAKVVLKSTSALHFKTNLCKRIIPRKAGSCKIDAQSEPNYRSDINLAKGKSKMEKNVFQMNSRKVSLNEIILKPKGTAYQTLWAQMETKQ